MALAIYNHPWNPWLLPFIAVPSSAEAQHHRDVFQMFSGPIRGDVQHFESF